MRLKEKRGMRRISKEIFHKQVWLSSDVDIRGRTTVRRGYQIVPGKYGVNKRRPILRL